MIWFDRQTIKFNYSNCVVPENIHTPPTEGIFHMPPPSPLYFPKTAHKLYPYPIRKFHFFSYTPWKYFCFLFKAKNKLNYSLRIQISMVTCVFW